jgi:hypothetical protein
MRVHLRALPGRFVPIKEANNMLTGIHFILTYACTFECDHCFLYCSPWSRGTFTISQVTDVLDEARRVGTVEWIFFEGGEPLLYFPLLLEGIKRAAERRFKVGVVTNAYGAGSEADARLWLEPLAKAGLSSISISNDVYHYGEEKENPAAIASRAAGRLGMDVSSISIEPPVVRQSSTDADDKGRPVIGGGAMFRGRAVETLTDNLPTRPWREFRECPYEALEAPSRVHVDSYGHVHICQGISMGNMWEHALSDIIAKYRPDAHPVCGPLLRGGPARLATVHGVVPRAGYVDACHFCFLTRKAMVQRFPGYLAPGQVYGAGR